MALPRRETKPSDFASDAERKAYARGYQCGARWPAHRPPTPPEGIVRDLMQAAMDLRDAADCICATFDAKDEVVMKLEPLIDAVDWQMQVITEWLKRDE